MSRRIEIEVTSVREGGGYTWRAAGAREPRGLLEVALAPAGVRVGDVLRVEVEADLDGITVLSVLPPREKSAVPGRIEVVGTPTELVPVTTTLAPRTEGRRPSRFDGGDDRRGARRSGRPGDRDRSPDRSGDRSRSGDRGPVRDGAPRGERTGERRTDRGAGRPGGPRTTEGSAGRPGGPRTAEGSAGRPGGPRTAEGSAGRPAGPRSGEGWAGREQHGAPPADRPRGEGAAERRPRGPAQAEDRPKEGARPTRGRPPRFVPGRARIDAVLGGLPPEQRPIADQLVAGGLPAVRRALAAAGDAGAGTPGDTNQAAILALAEQMLPAVKEALWLDRAEAAVEALEHLSLRDLRATVVGAVPRDDHGRELDRQLREALDQRLTRLRDSWQTDMARALEDGRVLQALRLSGRPPEPSARFPASLVTPLSEAASLSMAPDTPADRWAALLEATLASPVRRYVKPAGLPSGADEALLKVARQAAGRVPALAGLLGMAMPPPPGPAGAARPAGPPPGPPRPRRIPAPDASRHAPPGGEQHAAAAPEAVDAPPAAAADSASPSDAAVTDDTGAHEETAAPVVEVPETDALEPSAGAPAPEGSAAGQDAVHVEELSEAVNQG